MIIFLDIYLKVPDVDFKKKFDVVSSGVLGPYKNKKHRLFHNNLCFLNLNNLIP